MARTGRAKKAAEAMGRLWGDLPVVDAQDSLRIFPNSQDVANGIPRNPAECAFSQACKRLYGSSSVLFLRSVAYIDLPKADGSHRVERFRLTPAVRRQIEAFDKTGEVSTGGYLLGAPTGKWTLGYAHEKNARRKDWPTTGKRTSPQGPRPDPLTVAGVRNGAGAIQARTHVTARSKKVAA